MKIETLLSLAAVCKTKQDAVSIGLALEGVFNQTQALKHLPTANNEAHMEGESVFVGVELNREISNHYITMIRPEIREGTLSVIVCTQHMRDGLGLASTSWEALPDMEELLKPLQGETIAGMATRAKLIAIAHHAELIRRVGVPEEQAKIAARKSW